jgi:predicted nucleic acid-binding protein
LIVVDSSVWVDYFNGQPSPAADYLDTLLGVEPVAVGDLILAEVLQGFPTDREYRIARRLLSALPVYDLLGATRAIRAADNYRLLRRKGVTVRKTTDGIIATFCIESGIPLLFSDRDFEPYVKHLGLRSALAGARVSGEITGRP